jgi:hypothetical protein
MAASTARSVGSSLGRGVWRRSTATLVAEHEDLQLLDGVVMGEQGEELDGSGTAIDRRGSATTRTASEVGSGTALPYPDGLLQLRSSWAMSEFPHPTRLHPGRRGLVPAGQATGADRRRPTVQPGPLRRRQDRGGLQRPTSGSGRARHALGRAAHRHRPGRAANTCLIVAAAHGHEITAPSSTLQRGKRCLTRH